VFHPIAQARESHAPFDIMRTKRWLGLGLLVLLVSMRDARADAGSEPAKMKTTKAPSRTGSAIQQDNPTSTRVLLDERFRAGSAHAPVVLVVYACPRDEASAKLIPVLYHEVAAGRLKDKAVLYYRPFFAAGNDEAAQCGRALYAAAYQGRFWPYLLHLCREREHLGKAMLRDWVAEHGLDRCIFDHTCEQPEARAWLKAAHDEGVANGVRSAPAVFIAGQPVRGPLEMHSLLSEVERQYARMQPPQVSTRPARAQDDAH
jgi:protein-disulfide isomerase